MANRSLEETKRRLLDRIALAERERAEGGYTDGLVAMAELKGAMACKLVLLDSAKGEIDEAAGYLLAESGPKKAASDPRDDSAGNRQACEFPTMRAASCMPELAELGYRVMLAGSYVILYTFEEDAIFIAHVFRQRQDYAHLV